MSENRPPGVGPAAGWYPDPDEPGQLRYWSGFAWTEHRAPNAGGTEAASPSQPSPAGPYASPPPAFGGPDPSRASEGPADWWRKPWVLVAVGGLIGAALVGLGSNEGDESRQVAADPAPTVTATATETVEVRTTVTPDPDPVAKPKPSAAATTKRRASEAGNGARGGGSTFLMPNEVGRNLQIAQDDLQEKSGDPFFISFSEDATGAGRGQILDSSWVVCSQTPSPGTRIGLYADVTFFVVRAGENCP